MQGTFFDLDVCIPLACRVFVSLNQLIGSRNDVSQTILHFTSADVPFVA